MRCRLPHWVKKLPFVRSTSRRLVKWGTPRASHAGQPCGACGGSGGGVGGGDGGGGDGERPSVQSTLRPLSGSACQARPTGVSSPSS